MSDDIFSVFESGTSFGPTASNIPLRVGGYGSDPDGTPRMSGERMDTGEEVTIRLAELSNREFGIADKQYDWSPGSIVAIDGALEDPEHGPGNYMARWVNRVAKPDQGGSIRFGMARCYYDSRDRFNQFKNKMEVLGAPIAVQNPGELVAQATQAAVAASAMQIGWPKIAITMSSPDGSQGYMRCWNVATSGARGSKKVADEQGQAAHFQGEAFQKLANMISGLMREKNIQVAIHPAADISFGRKRAEMLERYRSMMPSDADAQREFVKADSTVNEITRFPIDERGEAMFSPCYFGFQHNERTLVGVRQFSSSGPYFEIAKMPSIDPDLMRSIAQADRFNLAGTAPPTHVALHGPRSSDSPAPDHSASSHTQQSSAPTQTQPAAEAQPGPAPAQAATTPPAQAAQQSAPAQTATAPAQAQSAPQSEPAQQANTQTSAPAPAANNAPAPAAAVPAQPPALPADVDDLTADLDIDGDISAQLEQAASAFNEKAPSHAPSQG